MSPLARAAALAAVVLGAAALAPGRAVAQLNGVCRGGVCADGYRGCGCDASCCERRLRGAAGSGSAGQGGGYSPEMATMSMMMGFMQSFSAMQGRRDAQDRQRQDAVAEERRRLDEIQSRLRAEEAVRAAAAAAEERRRLAKEFKGDAPDLTRTPEFKDEEPVRRAKPKPDADALCRERLPHVARLAGDDEAAWEAKQKAYLPRLAEWEKTCGNGEGAALIARASKGKVGALIAYESRLARLMAKAEPSRADLWEINRLFEAGEGLSAKLTAEERAELLGYEKAAESAALKAFDPAQDQPLSLLGSLKVEEPASFPSLRALEPGPALVRAIEGLDGAAKSVRGAFAGVDMNKELIPKSALPGGGPRPASPGRDWNLRRWLAEKGDQGQREIQRLVAELGSGGLQNQEDYAR